MVKMTGLSSALFDENYWQHRGAYDKGEFQGKGFWREFARTSGISLSDAQISELIANDIQTWTDMDPVMLDWARRLRDAGLQVAILSNMVKEIREHINQLEWLPIFQQNTWSYELGISKPDPAIYRHALGQLGVKPEETLFIDDLSNNVSAAEKSGLNAILFTTPAQLQADLNLRGLGEQLPPVIL